MVGIPSHPKGKKILTFEFQGTGDIFFQNRAEIPLLLLHFQIALPNQVDPFVVFTL